ncbi:MULTISPECIES: hypothetical protein [Pseudoalteromonas]|uniref:hypothetical protein n=1 Tax=Pseudoalteromonas TaxID=53246 RepID=UPI000AF3D225|nr:MULTISPECIES: hypothetical protein [Pseudoalteromonas]BDF93171.1 hypothetical protein KAN5_00090 [Pseudoalteromonas sp. KAN5]
MKKKKLLTAILGLSFGIGMTATVSAVSDCNWEPYGSIDNYCGYEYYKCAMSSNNSYLNCRDVKANCISKCSS